MISGISGSNMKIFIDFAGTDKEHNGIFKRQSQWFKSILTNISGCELCESEDEGDLKLFFYPVVGLSRDEFSKEKMEKITTDDECQLICSLLKSDLLIGGNESSPIEGINEEIKGKYGCKDIFICVEDDMDEEAFRNWLNFFTGRHSDKVHLHNCKDKLKKIKDEVRSELQRYTEKFAKDLEDSNFISSLRELKECADKQKYDFEENQKKHKRLIDKKANNDATFSDNITKICNNATKKLDPEYIPLNFTLASNLFNNERLLRRKLEQLLDECKKSLNDVPEFAGELESLAERVRTILNGDKPTLALLGCFSSGKTTLINTFILGQSEDSCKELPTSKSANTASIYEIAYAEKETVCFEYHKSNKVTLYDSDEGKKISPADLKIIKELYREGVICNCVIIIDDKIINTKKDNFNKSLDEALGAKKDASDDKKKAYLKYDINTNNPSAREYFYAPGVDHKVNTKEDWSKIFNSSVDDKRYQSLVFLAKKIKMGLNIEALQYINIVDTPGINSVNIAHDDITASCVKTAGKFVVLLSEEKINSSSTRELLKLLKKKSEEAKLQVKDMALFLINHFDERKNKLECVVQYKKILQDELKLEKDTNWSDLLFNFNIFNLRKLPKEQILGDCDYKQFTERLRSFAYENVRSMPDEVKNLVETISKNINEQIKSKHDDLNRKIKEKEEALRAPVKTKEDEIEKIRKEISSLEKTEKKLAAKKENIKKKQNKSIGEFVAKISEIEDDVVKFRDIVKKKENDAKKLFNGIKSGISGCSNKELLKKMENIYPELQNINELLIDFISNDIAGYTELKELSAKMCSKLELNNFIIPVFNKKSWKNNYIDCRMLEMCIEENPWEGGFKTNTEQHTKLKNAYNTAVTDYLENEWKPFLDFFIDYLQDLKKSFELHLKKELTIITKDMEIVSDDLKKTQVYNQELERENNNLKELQQKRKLSLEDEIKELKESKTLYREDKEKLEPFNEKVSNIINYIDSKFDE